MPLDFNPVLMSRFQDQVALVSESRVGWFEGCLVGLNERMDEIENADMQVSASDDFWSFEPDSFLAYLRPYKVKNGILQIPVRGVLLNNFPYAYGSWATGYEYIREAIKRGLDDSEVMGIVLVIDSGGGMVSGNWDLVDFISEGRDTKPIRAIAAEHAYSAAYNIAAATSHITVARTGGVGSIGVVIVHMEMSKLLDERGITVNIIRSKPGKMEGNSFEALSEDARKRFQEGVDESHKEFVAMVAKNRGLSEEAVDATNALTFRASQAIDNGLADQIGNFDDAITAFVASFNHKEDESMANVSEAKHTDEQLSTAVSDATKAAKAEGVSEGASAERTRITSILGSPEAKTRPAGALMMVNLGIAADAAVAELAKLPEEKPAAQTPATPEPAAGAGAPEGMLKSAMAGEGAHGVQPDGSDGEKQKKSQADEDRELIAAYGLSGFKGKE